MSLTTLTSSIYAVVGWSALMLTLAEGRVGPVPLTILLAFVAWTTEANQRMRMPAWFAAFLGMLAFAAGALEFSFGDIESRLLSVSHVIVYLTWILLFVRKTTRECWLLLALALLQMAVGAVLTIDGWYGLMLIVSLAMMLWTLAVFCHHNAHVAYGRASLVTVSSGRGKQSVFRGSGSTSGATQIDEGETWLGKRFRGPIVRAVFATLVIAGTVFAAVPRVFVGNPFAEAVRKAGREQAAAITGYSDEVRLGGIGTTLESSRPVMQVRMFDQSTGEQIRVTDFAAEHGMEEPLFRGTVMSAYRDGNWTKVDSRDEEHVKVPRGIQEPQVPENVVRQEITLRTERPDLLFVMPPYLAIQIPRTRMQARASRETGTVKKPNGWRLPIDKFSVYSPKPGESAFSPWPGSNRRAARWYRSEICSLVYSKVPGNLTRLKAIAATVGGTSEGLEPAPGLQARRIHAYLTNTDLFKYSLTGQREDTRLDPVEDFLVNHRTGNCEYFASAMTLMLRAQGIPARLVTGYKGGYTNEIDETLEVQEMHAHTWVEAHVQNNWVTFDPTPAGDSAAFASRTDTWKPLTDFRMWLNNLWGRLVVDMTPAEQKARIYDPVRNQFQAFSKAIQGKAEGGWKAIFSRRVWFSVPGFLVMVPVLVVLIVAIRKGWFKRMLNLFRKSRRAEASESGRTHPVVLFYDQFRSICTEHGRIRGSSETEREFAATLETDWSDRLEDSALGAFPTTLAEQFYRARFGEKPPEQPVLDDIETRLREFSEQLRVTAPVS